MEKYETSGNVSIVTYPIKMNSLKEREYKQKTIKEIIIAVNAMLNTNGGRLEMTYEQNLPRKDIDDIVRVIEQNIGSIIGVTTMISKVVIKFTEQKIVLVVMPTDTLSTVDYNLYFPTKSQVMCVPHSEPDLIRKIIGGISPPGVETSLLSYHRNFVLNQRAELREDVNVQLKKLKSKPFAFADRIMQNKFRYYISAFANHLGGHIYYGINDSGSVEGEILTDEDRAETPNKVQVALDKMIWPEHCKSLEKRTHWDIFFEPVKDSPNGTPIPNTYVVIIGVIRCPGGVFIETPESYFLNDDGQVMRMDFDAWKKKLLTNKSISDNPGQATGSDVKQERKSEEFDDTPDENDRQSLRRALSNTPDDGSAGMPSPAPERLKIEELNSMVYEKLCLDLNKRIPSKDYSALAGAMGYSSGAVKTFELSSNPADALLCDWKTKSGNDVQRLVYYLGKIGRDDLVELLDERTNKKAKAMDEVKWRQVSKKHRDKMEKLVQTLKTKPSETTRVGIYRMCLEKEFCIGEGSDGTKVYVGLCDDGREVAIKRLPLDICEDLGLNEIEILVSPDVSKTRHVVNYLFYQVDRTNRYFYIVLDLCEEDLKDYVRSRTIDELKKEGPKIFRQILKGLEALHCGDPLILHRDLRPGNILVNSENEMLLADFGLSRRIEEGTQTRMSKPIGAQGWVAVESLPTDDDDDENIDFLSAEEIKVRYKIQSDIQVTGMLFFYILMRGMHPYGRRNYDQTSNISKGKTINLEKLDDPVAKDLIQWMLKHDPKDRPVVQECLKHPYLLSTDQQFDLVTRVGNEREIKTNEPTSPVVQQLNADPLLPKSSWMSKVDEDVMKYLSEDCSYSDDMVGLLRLVRNTEENWFDKKPPTTIKHKVGKPKEYFLKLFPTLPVVLHRIIRNDPDWKKRERLEKFF